MQVAITVRHGELPQTAHDYITEKSEKLLHYFERVTQIQVTVDLEVDHQAKVEIVVDAEHKHDFVASESGRLGEPGEVRGLFDSALHKMEQQIRRYKEKIQDHRRDPRTGDVAGSEPDDDD